jgi:biopolymer transport protein ExbB/TolQ
MRTMGSVLLGCVTAMSAGMALAAEPVYVTGPVEAPVYTVVPVAERLTVGGVFADASPEMKLIMLLLTVATVVSVAVWAMSLGKVGKADAKGVAGALGRLRIVRSAGVPLGFLGGAYVMFSSFMGISNVRPAPSLTVVAPGLAEAMLAIMLGLLATTVAVICERHLEARVRRAAA